MSVKQIIKRGMQHVAARVGPQVRKSAKPRLLILMYHRVLPHDHPEVTHVEPGMMVTPGTLDMHLTLLRRHFELMTLSGWLKLRAAGKPLPSKACVVTFDDGWRDNADYAYPLLQKHQIPATIFLVADWIGTNAEFWPERLARLLHHIATRQSDRFTDSRLDWLRKADTSFDFGACPPSREQLNQLYRHCKQWRDDELHQRLDGLCDWLGLPPATHPSLMDWSQVSHMAGSGLVEFGSHTCRHIRLNTQLDSATMAHEIRVSQQVIANATGRPPETFCYPNGDYTPEAVNLVREQYLGAVSTKFGWNGDDVDPWLLKRIGLHEDVSRDEVSFLARLSGWL